MICGIDEVGRGCLAGRVHACAVAFHSEPPVGIRDSKKLSEAVRKRLDLEIRQAAHVSIGIAEISEIDTLNILQATMLAMTRAHDGLGCRSLVTTVLVDGNRAPRLVTDAVVRSIIGGDDAEVTIAAASICAKVARDAEMAELDLLHPGYGWNSNKGYGSPAHLAAIDALGPTPHHRMSFAPLRQASLDL
jgi:ribonuclease HII